ncbi:isopenicillin N synthase family oxygenase (plasmid) [Paroceanicella profunda]|uniref:2-oxoglutarate-dependent ethylene/succinate-forming enzyme n=1 Tax=Paroceanicella profunda TaxID=2579971 RepID=A0A5B8G3Q1_9RHOB|nr:2-oxoglutarate and iron-dependent oxygenase domain-containing protein [Paroceanicella profunda]QDL94009.1 isopenicillin N synthase family oxygenase [Paroceanicella profunda]
MIPVLDHAAARAGDGAAFTAGLSAACRETGFFLLTGHGVDPALTAAVFGQAAALFALPQARKEAVGIHLSPHNRGYVALGAERLDDTTGQVDRKEAFNIGLDLPPDHPDVAAGKPFRGVNLWPDLPGFRDTTLSYFNAAWALGVDLHRAIARDLGIPEGHFAPEFTAPMATLRLLRYPASAGGAQEIGAGAHTDYGSLTLLATDGTAGLQVRPRGQDWVDVPHVPGAFVVNIGDCLMRWTNDIYVSTPHRVLPPARERYSLAFFLDPNPETEIAALPGTGAPKYPAIRAADYLAARLAATYDKKG